MDCRNHPLRYEIDSWSELPKCQSNSSPLLHLTCTSVLDKSLSGTLIRVEHDRFGCLFSYLVDGSGPLLMEQVDGVYHEFTPEDILYELGKYGFDIRFSRSYNISVEQMSALVEMRRLNMDKIRFMYVDNGPRPGVTPDRVYRGYLVSFNIEHLPRWLDNNYVCSKKEFTDALVEGYAVNVTALGQVHKYNWSFLRGKVLSIEDIIKSEKVIVC